MKINEIFESIQGEGILAGLPTIFIRTTGCNLRCDWCDTKYAYNKGRELGIGNILTEIRKFGSKRTCITGGEPLLQEETIRLIEQLIQNDYSVSIETNGSKDISVLPKEVLISLDIKCPSSNEQGKILFKNLRHIKKKDQCKFVINDKKDYEYAKKMVEEHNLINKTNVFFSPVNGIDAKNIARWVLKDNLDVKIGLQLHKIIWGSNKRGV